ncbi:hypothetical protein S40293_10097 [Stachybotrys chartarum IBT 40293]|nr:hypothetical protein S40293_10097 [Stachybotrys chartarum IBT 40293]
MEHVVRLKPKI